MDIPITTRYNGKGVKQAQSGLAALAKTSLASSLSVAALGAAFVKLGKDAVTAALAEERAVRQLSRVLENSGRGEYTDSVLASIDAMQMASGVSEDKLRPAFLDLYQVTQDVAASQSLLKLAMDISAGTGRDLSETATALTRALAGQRRGLMSLGTGIDKTTLQSADLATVFDTLERKFSGSSASAADTMSGKLDRIRRSAEDASETVGKGLVDAFLILAADGGRSVDSLQRKMADLSTDVADFVRGFAVLTDTVRDAVPSGPRSRITGLLGDLPYYKQVGMLLDKIGDGAAKVTAVGRNASLISAGGSIAGNERQQINAARAATRVANAERASRNRAAAAADARDKAAAARAAADKRARDRAAAAQAAKEKREAALARQKELALMGLQMEFDVERISIVAALRREQDEQTRKRLEALLILNTAGYDSELVKIAEVNKALQTMYGLRGQIYGDELTWIERNKMAQLNAIAAVVAAQEAAAKASASVTRFNQVSAELQAQQAAARASGTRSALLGAIDSFTSSGIGGLASAALRDIAASAEARAQANVVVNISGSVVAQQDLQQAVVDAINGATRNGVTVR